MFYYNGSGGSLEDEGEGTLLQATGGEGENEGGDPRFIAEKVDQSNTANIVGDTGNYQFDYIWLLLIIPILLGGLFLLDKFRKALRKANRPK